jgi:hypothetical protein
MGHQPTWYAYLILEWPHQELVESLPISKISAHSNARNNISCDHLHRSANFRHAASSTQKDAARKVCLSASIALPNKWWIDNMSAVNSSNETTEFPLPPPRLSIQRQGK